MDIGESQWLGVWFVFIRRVTVDTVLDGQWIESVVGCVVCVYKEGYSGHCLRWTVDRVSGWVCGLCL